MNVNLAWQAPVLQPGQSTLATFRIYSKVGGAPNFGLLNEVPATQVTLIDENVDPGDWSYQVTTVDSKGRESSPSNIATVTVPSGGVPPDSVAPSPPTNLTATLSQ